MLNEQKIKKMRKLAAYESGKGREDLSISNYYRSDYIGLAMIKNFFITTIAYVLLLAVYFGYNSEYIIDNLHKIDLFSLGIKIIIIYIALLVAYTILTYIYCSVKYRSAQKGVEEYYRELGQLKKIYDREEKRAGRLTGRRKGA